MADKKKPKVNKVDVNSNSTRKIELPDGGVRIAFDQVNPMSPTDSTEAINMAFEIQKSSKKFLAPENGEEVNSEEFLKQLGQVVYNDFEHDEQSRQLWEQRMARILELFAGYMPPKTKPWVGCSNVNLPFITVACMQFHARATEAIMPPRNIANVKEVGNEDTPRAKRVAKYLNYQLLHRMTEFEEDMDKHLIQLCAFGSAFKKTFYDPIEARPKSIYVSATDMVVNYHSRRDEGTRKTHVLHYTRNEIRQRAKMGVYINDAWKLPHGDSESPLWSELEEATRRIEGQENSNQYSDYTRVILEQYRNVDIDGDGIEEPVVVTIDHATRKVLRITSRLATTVTGQAIEVDYITHYRFFPSPIGYYGLGFGQLLYGLNEAGNTILNEVIDSGSLANIVGGWIKKSSGVKRGDLTFQMGEFKELDIMVDSIDDAIKVLDFKGPNTTLYSVLGLLFEYNKLVSGVSETMTGQLPASDTPATTVMALIEEGRKVFSSIHRRIHRSFKRELQKIYRINSIYLNVKEYYQVVEDLLIQDPGIKQNMLMAAVQGKAKTEAILVQKLSQDFAGDLDVIPVSDPTIISKAERMIKAKEVRDDVARSPLTANDKNALYLTTRAFYEAMEVDNVDAILQPPGPPPDIPAVQENGMFIKEQTSHVLPKQDHMSHIKKHRELIEGSFAEELTPTAKRIIEDHNREHLAALYVAEEGGEQQGVPQ